MTSLEIAELTGKQHKNVMQAIRNMEPAWEKVHGLKFQLIDYKDRLGRIKPCYQLTKTECLYIATKFNDEARAKLVLRWEYLERKEQESRQQLCLPEPKKILALADEIISEGLHILPVGILLHTINGDELAALPFPQPLQRSIVVGQAAIVELHQILLARFIAAAHCR